MAQNQNYIHYNDVGNTIIKTSPKRIRNILTLKEKMAVIKTFELWPAYMKVARMFNCSWEQINSIILHRNVIIECYNASINQNKPETIEDDVHMDFDKRKIKFLGDCICECLQRVQYHAKVPITENLIKHRALEFLDVLPISRFMPTKKWLNSFMETYSISWSNRQMVIHNKPQSSPEIKDITAFCPNEESTQNLIYKCNYLDELNFECEAKRLRKLNFLKEALKQYILRVEYHHKSVILDDQALRRVAKKFCEILNLQDFEPTLQWINYFVMCCDTEEYFADAEIPPLSLDLPDILSYCSHTPNRVKENTKLPEKSFTESYISYLDKQESEREKHIPDIEERIVERSQLVKTPSVEADIKPDIEELRLQIAQQEAPPFKIHKIESINNDPELQLKSHINSETRKEPLIMQREKPTETTKPPTERFAYIQKVNPSNVSKVNVVHLNQEMANVEIKKDSLLRLTATPLPNPQLRIQQIHHELPPSCRSPSENNDPPSSSEENDSEGFPRRVTSFKDILLLLKPIEEYAMLKENYLAIALITKLEEALENPPEEENSSDDDEEFIG